MAMVIALQNLLLLDVAVPLASVGSIRATGRHCGLEDEVQDKPVTPASSYLDDETNVRIPRGLTESQRLRLLELKVASATGWLKDPFVGFDPKYRDTCKNLSNLSEYGCAEGKDKCGGGYDHAICLDDWSPGQGNCLVYDFGIRENPEFGEVMARTFNCEVHAFDPSPITLKWFPTSEVAKLPNYHFHPYGVAGTDGIIQLHEYDWGQVSIVRDIYPPKQPKDFFNLPVKTLGTIMQELGHEGREIDMLKIDVEGSEFSVLEDALDSLGCLPAKQVTLEWHHYAFDPRYGGGSSPSVNTIVNIMHACGLKMFWRHSTTGWMSPEPRYKEAGLNDIR
ncbi:methyltransferase domain-containing protein [Tribonema minus]|uniref:Methyltransferase domain-containing protein n=1 Tax=Tribonema minus TaxID=303371 RepID=A0A836CF17_9STRA|nr:methyltransferase domain-containing protein [Tribonema minus]